MTRSIVGLLLASLLGGSGAARAAPPPLPPQSAPQGATYGEWSNEWVRWAFETEFAAVLDADGSSCGVGQSGRVWFLAGTFGDVVSRECVVPAGETILLPVINGWWISTLPEDPTDAEGIAALLDVFFPALTGELQLDGRAIDLEGFLVTSPLTQIFLTAEQSGDPPNQAGLYPMMTRGIYVVLPPLPAGGHAIHLVGRSLPPGIEFSTEVSYALTVR